MDNDSFVYLDTSAIDKAIDMKDDILNGYRKIGEEYNRIVVEKNTTGKAFEVLYNEERKWEVWP